MSEIEAISVLETRIKYPNSDTYGGMCEAEYQQEAVALAIEALREKREREKGCGFCNTGAHRILSNALYCPRCGKRLEEKNGGENHNG